MGREVEKVYKINEDTCRIDVLMNVEKRMFIGIERICEQEATTLLEAPRPLGLAVGRYASAWTSSIHIYTPGAD